MDSNEPSLAKQRAKKFRVDQYSWNLWAVLRSITEIGIAWQAVRHFQKMQLAPTSLRAALKFGRIQGSVHVAQASTRGSLPRRRSRSADATLATITYSAPQTDYPRPTQERGCTRGWLCKLASRRFASMWTKPLRKGSLLQRLPNKLLPSLASVRRIVQVDRSRKQNTTLLGSPNFRFHSTICQKTSTACLSERFFRSPSRCCSHPRGQTTMTRHPTEIRIGDALQSPLALTAVKQRSLPLNDVRCHYKFRLWTGVPLQGRLSKMEPQRSWAHRHLASLTQTRAERDRGSDLSPPMHGFSPQRGDVPEGLADDFDGLWSDLIPGLTSDNAHSWT
jgi:hypothetical protein